MSSQSEPVIEAEVVPDDPSVEIVHQPRRGEVLRPLDIAQQKDAMSVYQQGLREILDESDWQNAGRGERFVKKSGWRKIAAWFDLSIELIRDEVDRDDDGNVTRAMVWARAVAPSGRFADGDGYCDVHEKRFEKEAARQKLENDLRGTATTRAVNRAVSNLVGMGAVSAEEMHDPPPPAAAGPPLGPVFDPELKSLVGAACTQLAGGQPELGRTLFASVKRSCGGYLPQAAALAIIDCASPEREPEPPDLDAPRGGYPAQPVEPNLS